MDHRILSRSLTTLAAASLLAACQGGAASPPPLPGTAGAQSAARAIQSHEKKDAPELTASPASLEFTAGQAAAGTPQTVTITAESGRMLAVTIAGTGNCPAVSPAALQLKRVDEDGDRDRDHHDRATGTLTVTPAGAGPAACTITVASAKRGHGRGGDHDRDGDRDRHDDDDAGASLMIAVTVDAPPPPTPVPTTNPCANNSCR